VDADLFSEQRPVVLGIGFSKIAFSTSNTNLVVATTAGNLGFDFGLEQDGNSTARGIYYSIDAGATWNKSTLAGGTVAASVTGLVYNPSQGSTGLLRRDSKTRPLLFHRRPDLHSPDDSTDARFGLGQLSSRIEFFHLPALSS